MPIEIQFPMARFEDSCLTIHLVPPAPIGGQELQFEVSPRFTGSGFIHKVSASGFNGVSGIEITNSGQGIFNVTLHEVEMSGREDGCYAVTTRRMTSGSMTLINRGYMLFST